MSVESAKAKLDAQPGDPATGYISKADHQDSYTELVDDTALTGATTAEALTISGNLNGRDPDNLVAGPGSSTDNALVRFDGTGGKTVQNSGITVDDSNNISGLGTVAGTGLAGSLLSSTSPVMDGVAAAGTGVVPSRQDHVHPTDTSRAPTASPTFTGRVTVASGAANGISQSGTLDLVGTGSPEGVVTAPVGSTWRDTNATTGAIKWIKTSGTGNTGWVVEYGDTGIRDLTASDTPHVNTTVTYFQVRRQGTAVTLNYYQATSSSVNDVLMFDALPVGFRPTHNITAIRNRGGVLSASDQIVWDIRSNGQVYYSSAGASTMQGEVTWQTPDAWPTSLPGSAA